MLDKLPRSSPYVLAHVLAISAACDASKTSPLAEDGGGEDDSDGGDDGGDDAAIGCEGASGSASQPFGNHELAYVDGSAVPDEAPSELDDAVREAYDRWKSRYLEQGCGDDRYLVATGQSDSLTVSEAHGYGMIIEAFMAGHEPDARKHFDGLFRYFTEHPSAGNGSLMAWSQDLACDNNQGGYSATDGDLDIAYALLLADKQWGSGGGIDYRAEAVAVISAIMNSEVDSTGSHILLGDWANAGDPYYYRSTRTSDFMPGHVESFEAVINNGDWNELNAAEYEMFGILQDEFAPQTGLVPDFVQLLDDAPIPAEPEFLERPVDGAYSFNACRVPWRLGVHFLTTGDPRARATLRPLNQWIQEKTGGNADDITAGYWLDGSNLPSSDYESMAYIAPLGVGAMVDASNSAWVSEVWNKVRWAEGDGSYYGDTLRLLSMIAMSGNWWAPQSAPCPS